MPKCISCKDDAIYSVLLAKGIDNDGSVRWYLPNQSAREHPKNVVTEVWFCHPCMRAIEDNMRATIQYLQKEGGPVSKRKNQFITKRAKGKGG